MQQADGQTLCQVKIFRRKINETELNIYRKVLLYLVCCKNIYRNKTNMKLKSRQRKYFCNCCKFATEIAGGIFVLLHTQIERLQDTK